MASPPAHHNSGGDKGPNPPDQYYIIVALGAIALAILLSNANAARCVSLNKFLCCCRDSQGESNIGGDPWIVILVCKYRKREGDEPVPDSECSVCLMAFADGEDVRELPECKHTFHVPCIDMWLYSHSNCPLCRANVAVRPPEWRIHVVGVEESGRRGPPELGNYLA